MRSCSGQSLTESIVVLPLFLIVGLCAVQLGQIGMALVLSNYAASSVARKAANEQDFSHASKGTPLMSVALYNQKAADLMVGGIQLDPGGIVGCVDSADSRMPTAELNVAVRSKMGAWPLVGSLVHTALKDRYNAQPLNCPDLENAGGFGPFNFSGGTPYTFYVTATAKVRLNYIQ